jgi:hypothetical protein
MAANEVRWIVRLTPPTGQTVRHLLRLPLALDVWERGKDALVAAVPEATLRELERRRLAGVERLGTTAEHEARAGRLARRGGGADP